MITKLKLAAAGSLLLAPLAYSGSYPYETYYSVDVTNDALCAVNVESGQVTYLGPLGAHFGNVDLAWQQNALYAKTWGTPVGNKIYQIVIDGHYTGFALQGGPLHGSGYSVGALGGLASDGNSIYLAYSKSNPNNNYSNSFGTVAACWDGLIAVAAPDAGSTHDIDGMGFAGGQFWGIDVLAPGTGYMLYRGASATGPITAVGGELIYDLATNPLDVESYDPDWLVAVTQDGLHLVRVNRLTGVRGVHKTLLGLQPGGVLNGIAKRPAPCGRVLGFAVQHP